MTIIGEYPEQGMRVSFERLSLNEGTVEYNAQVTTSSMQHTLKLTIVRATGEVCVLHQHDFVRHGFEYKELADSDRAFVCQLAKQLWKHAEQQAPEMGDGHWPQRIQRWRGPK